MIIETMATQINTVVNELKRRIISNVYQPGERLVEVQLAQELNVSRTPIRLAFEELTKDGLLEKLPKRGFKVKAFNPVDFANAIDVRGTLEGMAARLVTEQGVDESCLQVLRSCLVEGQNLLQEAARNDYQIDVRRWMVINAKFHDTLIHASANPTLADAIDFVSKVPLAGATATALDTQGMAPQLGFSFIQRAQQDHCDVVAAIENKESMRAEAIMREHARRTRDNKQKLLAGQTSV